MAPDHPSVGRLCPACHEPFVVGDMTGLVVYGPGGDPEARVKAAAGLAYTAVAAQVHWACATGEVIDPGPACDDGEGNTAL